MQAELLARLERGNNSITRAKTAMLTETQRYECMDALNELLEPLSRSALTAEIRMLTNGNDPFSIYDFAQVSSMIDALPAARLEMLETLLITLATVQGTMQTNAIGNKSRLIKADVLEWSDNAALSNQDLGSLRGNLLKRLRMIFGLRSIEALLAEFGRGAAIGSMCGPLSRS